MSQLTLVSHHLCPYVQRAAIALLEKGVPFRRVMVDFAAKPDWFTAISPLGKVPLLRVPRPEGGEAVLFESAVICEFIEETQAGPPLHPRGPLDRARNRGWMEFGSAILGDVWGLETAADPDLFATKRQALQTKFARVEDALAQGPFFGGTDFSLVDAVFAPIFRYFDVFDRIADLGTFDHTSKVSAWREELANRRSVRDAVDADYGDRLRAFLERHDAYLLRLPRLIPA